jgi:putative ABC transport system substrate-binding protein
MRRRSFITLLGGAAVWPLAARAQQAERVRHIAVLMPVSENDPEGQARVAALMEELRRLGWKEGGNLTITKRWAAGDARSMRIHAAELVVLKPDLIIVQSNEFLTYVRAKTRDIPIVVVVVSDPVGGGFAASLARPGGNITGFANQEPAMGAKWLQLLKQVAPDVQRAVVIRVPNISAHTAFVDAAEAAAGSVGVMVQPVPVRDAAELESVIGALLSEPNTGLIVLPSPLAQVQRGLIVDLAARHAVPAVYPFRFMAASGGLLSYGIDIVDLFRRAASYVDRILKGEKTGDLPIQLPTKFELVINLKTAKALGLEIPPTLLARADEVIE